MSMWDKFVYEVWFFVRWVIYVGIGNKVFITYWDKFVQNWEKMWEPSPDPKNLPILPDLHTVSQYDPNNVVDPCGLKPAMMRPGPVKNPRKDPIVLDLDGNGAESAHIKNGAHFDYSGDGFAELTGWINEKDGFLVIDRNGDGKINDGKELFGDQTILKSGKKASDGFEALVELDSNNDGKLDSSDKDYSLLKVWCDEDGDGRTLPQEIHTLDELGIKSISLQSNTTSVRDAQGNTQTRVSTFERSNGAVNQIFEYSFQTDSVYTISSEWLALSDDIQTLPNLPGYGSVYELAQASVAFLK